MFEIKQCLMCGCTDVSPAELEVKVRAKHIKSVKVDGAKCSKCGEEYYDSQTLKAIETLEKDT
ncbi:hypothetical protein HN020_02795 [Brevibacillus borstelensis]|uniref:hypothetical protein n=1 Tax=Brevibacillus borstelensis TaxID=45462 RepID=UPI00148FA44A|nr:hypothetical protein [Brevibacillus borstelensis]NOU53731.1 hypothetical protein [Brevibacillus borstelensis]